MTALEQMAARLSVAQRGLAEAQAATAAAQRRVAAGSAGEALVASVLAGAGVWHILGRLRPGRRGDLDAVVATRSGVFVLDVKHWAEVHLGPGALAEGQDDRGDVLDGALRQAHDVEEVLAPTGLSPLEVHPVLVFTRDGASLAPQQLGRLVLVGVDHLARILTPRADRLPAPLLSAVREQLDASLVEPGATRDAPGRSPSRRRAAEPDLQLRAFDLEALDAQQVRFADDLPLERWMVWLDPLQHHQVRRVWNGPARVRGPAGTGKTVLALHRAAYLAESSPGRILVTSFVRTLPSVLGAQYRRLSPGTADRVDFVGLHAVALRVLRARMTAPPIDQARIDTAFSVAWLKVGRAELGGLGLGMGYWREEVDAVIKGRDLRDPQLYLDAERIGRRTPLGASQRASVWRLYEAYEAELRRLGVIDWNDLLRLARDTLRGQPAAPYRHLVVDEVQDLPTVGLQLLRQLVPEAPDDLFVVGDGQQSVYPGGGTLKEAGISVAGRGVVLSVNYRNPQEILDAALALVAGDRFDDLEGVDEPGLREVTTRRTGGTVRVDRAATPAALEPLLLRRLSAQAAQGTPPGAMAVLAEGRAEAARLGAAVRRGGFAVQPLEQWDGVTGAAAVKVGTVKRAKGLEFDAVFFVDVEPPHASPTEDERARRRREAFVAMTRARSHLWVGTLTPGSPPG